MQELEEKFFIPALVLDARGLEARRAAGASKPFDDSTKVLVCSYHFARAQADAIRAMSWDLVVMDEAHRLRNVYKSGNKIARALKDALAGHPKVLLTATPLRSGSVSRAT